MKILKLNSKNIKKAVKEIAGLIREGKVIICPTDTVYGLVADATNEKAISKIFKIKKRQRSKAISIFVKDIESAKKISIIGSSQASFLEEVWPGKVTVVLRKRDEVSLPKILFGQEKTIGLRIPDYELIVLLLKELNVPLTGTSANISGESSMVRVKRVLDQFKNQKYQPDLIVDAGDLEVSKPSTVIDLTKPEPRILRIGSALSRK